jgi:hypothetical protein
MDTTELIPIEAISQRIFIIRGVKVMLDADLAKLYGIRTMQLNQAVKRNFKRFPSDFTFRLSSEEAKELNLSQIVIGCENGLDRSQLATSHQKHRDPRFLPYAFTEHGVAMLSTVLRSERAAEMSVYIVRAFIISSSASWTI